MFENQEEVHSLTQAAVVLVTYVFLVLILYFVLSTPVNMIFDGFDTTNWAAAEPQHASTMSNIRQTWTIFCAILSAYHFVGFSSGCSTENPVGVHHKAITTNGDK